MLKEGPLSELHMSRTNIELLEADLIGSDGSPEPTEALFAIVRSYLKPDQIGRKFAISAPSIENLKIQHID